MTTQQIEHQLFIAESTCQAVAMGGGDTVRVIFLDRDCTPEQRAEIGALRLGYLGVFACVDGVPQCKLADDADLRLAVKAGAEYGRLFAARKSGASTSWLERLHSLPDTRTGR